MGTLLHAIAESDALYAELSLDERTCLVVGPLVNSHDLSELGVGYLVAVVTEHPAVSRRTTFSLREGHAALLEMLFPILQLMKSQQGWAYLYVVWVVDSLEAAMEVLHQAGYVVSLDSLWHPLSVPPHADGTVVIVSTSQEAW